MSATDMSALLVMAVRFSPAMFAETKHIIATSTWIQEKVMPWVVNRRMDTLVEWGDPKKVPTSYRSRRGRLHNALYANSSASRIQNLLRWGADTRVCEESGKTPAHCAILRPWHAASHDTIHALIEADPGAICIGDKYGKHALHAALFPIVYAPGCYTGPSCVPLVKMLLEAAPDAAHAPCSSGQTPTALVKKMHSIHGVETELLILFGIFF